MIYCNYDTHLRGTLRFAVMYINGNELEKYASMYLYKYKLITEAAVHRQQNDCSTHFGKFPGKQSRWSHILLQLQLQSFQNRYFLCNTSRRLLLNLQTIPIVPAPSCLPYLYIETSGEKRIDPEALQNDCSTYLWTIPWKATAVDSYFCIVTGLAILLKQDLTTFYVTYLNGCFYIYRQFSRFLPSLSCTTCIQGQEGEEGCQKPQFCSYSYYVKPFY